MKWKKLCFVILVFVTIIPLYAGDGPVNVSTQLNIRCTSTLGYNIETELAGFETVVNWFEFIFTPSGWNTFSTPPGSPEESYTFFTVTGLNLSILANLDDINSNGTNSTIDYDWLSLTNIAGMLVTPWVWIGIVYQGQPENQVWHYHQFIADHAMIGSRTCYRALQGGGMGAGGIKDADAGIVHRDRFQAIYEVDDYILVGYDSDLFSVIGKLGSRYSLFDTTVAPQDDGSMAQEFAFGVDSAIRPIPGLEVGVDAYATTFVDSSGDPMFSTKVTYDIPLYKSLYLQPFAAFDGQVRTDGLEMEVSAGINIPWPGGGWKEDPIYILRDDSSNVDNAEGDMGTPSAGRGEGRYTKQNTFGGLTLGFTYADPGFPDDAENSDAVAMIDFSIFEERGDEGLYKDIGMTLSAQVFNLTGNIEFGIAAYMDIEIVDDTFLPFLAFEYQNYDQENYSDEDALEIHVGFQYIKIPNATIGIEYGSHNLLVNPDDPND
jgi:hypothetical protein